MTEKMLTQGTAYSGRHGITLIVPGTGDYCGNSKWSRGKGDVRRQVELVTDWAVADAQNELGHWPGFDNIKVSVHPLTERGAYRVFVYGERKA